MSRLKPIHCMAMFTSFFMPSTVQSEPVTLAYRGGVELIIVDSLDADFECANNGLPARIKVGEETGSISSSTFPTTFLERPESPPQVRLRKTGKLVPLREERRTYQAHTHDWSMTVSGDIDLCVGPAKLQLVQGRLDVFAQLGQYEGGISGPINMLQNLSIEYFVNLSNAPRPHISRSDGLRGFDWTVGLAQTKGQEGELAGIFGWVYGPDSYAEDGVWGRLDLVATQLPINFIGPGDLQETAFLTHLHIKLILEEAS